MDARTQLDVVIASQVLVLDATKVPSQLFALLDFQGSGILAVRI